MSKFRCMIYVFTIGALYTAFRHFRISYSIKTGAYYSTNIKAIKALSKSLYANSFADLSKKKLVMRTILL